MGQYINKSAVVAEVYSGRTIDNIIQQLEACAKHAENNTT